MAKLLRGRVLSFARRPEDPDDTDAYTYLDDGAVAVDADGRIVAVGDYGLLRNDFAGEVIDHRPHLILPGFIDTHLHFVQMQVVGSWAPDLLTWLNQYTFVAEQRFADPVHAGRIASAFFDELIRQGTTTAAAYCSVHPASAEAFFAGAAKRNMAVAGGKVMMDREAPEALTDTAQRGYDESKALADKWDGRGRARYAITPRFALSSTPAQLEAAGALAREFPDCLIQTHLDENHGEIARAAELYPDAPDYAGIYERYGLLTERTLLGHAIHLEQREIDALADTAAVAVHCPTSNLFLGSGLFDRAGLEASGVRTAIATDIGGGTSYSMLRTLDEAYKIAQLRGAGFDPLQGFYWATRGNAEAMGMSAEIGSIEEGRYADLVVLDAAATPAMALRMETVETLTEELFLLQTAGDDRAVVETYVAGTPIKAGS